MYVFRVLRYCLLSAVFAAAFSIAYGDPPPKQSPEPGVTVLAAVVPSQDPDDGSPGFRTGSPVAA
jgi:hypothetical protein